MKEENNSPPTPVLQSIEGKGDELTIGWIKNIIDSKFRSDAGKVEKIREKLATIPAKDKTNEAGERK